MASASGKQEGNGHCKTGACAWQAGAGPCLRQEAPAAPWELRGVRRMGLFGSYSLGVRMESRDFKNGGVKQKLPPEFSVLAEVKGPGGFLGPGPQPAQTPCQSQLVLSGGNFPVSRMGTAGVWLQPEPGDPEPSLDTSTSPTPHSHLLGFPRPHPNHTVIRESVTVTAQRDLKGFLQSQASEVTKSLTRIQV